MTRVGCLTKVIVIFDDSIMSFLYFVSLDTNITFCLSRVPYVTLAEKLSRLAAQLVAGGNALKSVKLTLLASAREFNNLKTELLHSMVAKGTVDQPGIIGTIRNILDEDNLVPKNLQVRYVTLAEKLSRLAAQLVTGGNALKSIKLTLLASAREFNNLETELLHTMVAKGTV
ncbi:D-3-phosphoglycerate dehydrogenase [Artemisia annua]|uniref:D-3-phosphoglycerate dehydrogenase n=1 Tax=Artemisia annua TaxID=35608 RepID=A0A2U1P675_ARTAN|nr:D-3-phosphoglycerate dehydrogenase [Artemisia annua]